MDEKVVRVRFAPSPTGPLHIGGARSALFNWLVARKSGGKFVLRIEDTDLERSSRESEENIKNALRWLGLDWDEGIDIGGPGAPYRQTERLDLYRKYTQNLLDEGKAYHCYCTDEELEAERQELIGKGEMPRYRGRCANLTIKEKAEFEKEGRKPTVRFRVPQNKDVIVNDLIRGNVSFDSNGIGDFVIVKSDGIPTYNYAVVIDDALMDITHVIRGEEHLSNTPRQILIYQALGFEEPKFGHVSLILGKDRSKMSKRHGSTAVEQYKNKGYLPSGLLNFLVMLGWAPKGEKEIYTLDELVKEFSLDACAKNPAVFDPEKLNWINAHHIKKLSNERLYDMALPYLMQAGFFLKTTYERAWLVEVVATTREHISYFAQIPDFVKVYFEDDVTFENDEVRLILKAEGAERIIQTFKERLWQVETLDADNVKILLKALVKELGLQTKQVYMTVRVALTGQTHGPEMTQLIPLLGAQRATKRVENSLNKA